MNKRTNRTLQLCIIASTNQPIPTSNPVRQMDFLPRLDALNAIPEEQEELVRDGTIIRFRPAAAPLIVEAGEVLVELG